MVRLEKHSNAKKMFYFVQDFEAYFSGRGSEAILAERTYNLGIHCICSSPWLARLMRERGSETTEFIYPADAKYYFPPSSSKQRVRDTTPLIALYARSFTYRRAVELAIAGLACLFERGVAFKVALFGQQFDENSKWPFPVEFYHVLNERALGHLFRQADLGIVFSATNYSITAVEMMASGLALIDLDGESTRETYPGGAVTLCAASPNEIADCVEKLVQDPALRAKQAATALAWIRSFSWPEITDSLEELFVSELAKLTPSTRISTMRKTTKVVVAIPTYNGEETIAAVLSSVQRQSTPHEFEVLCIDSGSTDQTA